MVVNWTGINFRYYGQGRITHDNYIQFIRHFTLGDEYLDQSKNYVPQVSFTDSQTISSVNRRHFFLTVRQVKKEYNVIKNKGGNYAALEESRKEVLEQIPQEPNTEEALAFYQSTYGYTEDLRVVIQDLRLRIKVTLGFL